jgi:DNA processing protein
MATLIDVHAQAFERGQLGYPVRLATLDDAPAAVWIAGRWSPAERAVAVVGARAAGARAIELGRAIGAHLTRVGVDVISGGAIGVDAAAHRGALDGRVAAFAVAGSNPGATVAVLGTGIDVAYPARHLPLYQEVVASGGALLTQFAPGTTPRPGRFPTRNRVIAGLAELVVVVEASLQSGSLSTAAAARELGRLVAAVPGSPGTDQLILNGASAVASPDDVLAVLEGRAPAPPALPADPNAARLYAALDHVPRDVGDLAFRAGLAIGTCAALVGDLEVGGLAARASGGRYIRLR